MELLSVLKSRIWLWWTTVHENVKLELLALSEIGLIARQMLVALSALKNAGITHTKIKPEHMFVDHCSQHFRVKLVDFGSACMWNILVVRVWSPWDSIHSPEVFFNFSTFPMHALMFGGWGVHWRSCTTGNIITPQIASTIIWTQS